VGPAALRLSPYQAVALCRYSTTVTGALESVLGTWLVDNKQDQDRLRELARHIGRGAPDIVRTSFAVKLHNMPPHMLPPAELPTVARILQV
jgi:hypothetical protein